MNWNRPYNVYLTAGVVIAAKWQRDTEENLPPAPLGSFAPVLHAVSYLDTNRYAFLNKLRAVIKDN